MATHGCTTGYCECGSLVLCCICSPVCAACLAARQYRGSQYVDSNGIPIPIPDRFAGFVGTPNQIANFIEWMADQPCSRIRRDRKNIKPCRTKSPHDPEWCCMVCQAYLLRYGAEQGEE